MDALVVKRLLALNREFYAAFANEFSVTRSSERINLNPIKPYVFNGARLLDVGCGNGRLAERLDREAFELEYVGIDVTAGLIEMAKARPMRRRRVKAEFRVVDIAARGWTDLLEDCAPFDMILALAVLHHVPSFDLRGAVMRGFRKMLKPGGTVIMSNWQFTGNARLSKKIVPWTRVGLEAREVEPGDAVLDWKRGGTGYRYLHLLDPTEIESLAHSSGLRVLEQFYADTNLNLWSVLGRVAIPQDSNKGRRIC